MAKQKYEDKRVISICGVLDCTEDGYNINVEDKDGIETFSFNDILNECNGQIISITCEFV